MDKSRPGFFTKIYYSIAGFEKYRLFLRQSIGRAISYLILLSLIASLFVFVPQQIEFNKMVDHLTKNFDSIIPDFTFSGGELSVNAKMPIIIDSGSMFIVIDTSDDAEDILVNYDSVILITGNKIIQKYYTNRNEISLSTLSYLNITKEDIEQSLPYMKYMGALLFFFYIVVFTCGRFIMAFLVSLIGLAINSMKQTGLSYRSIFKLSIYSITLPTLLIAVVSYIPFQIPFLGLIYYIIASVYMYGAINIIKKGLDGFNTGNTQF